MTGGSSGIGLWVAIYAARAGANVTIVARKTELLGRSNNKSLNNHTKILSRIFIVYFSESRECH